MPYRRLPPRKQYQQGTRKAPVQRGFQHGAGGHPVLEAKIYSQKWSVPSSSDPNKTYTVSLTADGQWECSCPQWIYRRQECKHMQRIKKKPHWRYSHISQVGRENRSTNLRRDSRRIIAHFSLEALALSKAPVAETVSSA